MFFILQADILIIVDIGVLGAFSHLQRERRKHDVHIATLRAQSEFFRLGRREPQQTDGS